MNILPGAMPFPELDWDYRRFGLAGRCLLLASFALSFALLVVLGYALRDDAESLSIIWPASGLLLVALWTSPGRNWGVILAIQLIVQIGIYLAYVDRPNWVWGPLFAMADSLAAVVGALAARRLVTSPSVASLRQVVNFLAALGLGEGAGALLGAYASMHTAPGTHFLRQWQLWWVGSALGSLLLVLGLVSWSVRFRARHKTAPSPDLIDLILCGGALLGSSYWIASSPPEAITSLLQSPTVVVAAALVVAFRMPPRWAATFTALSVLIIAYFTSRHMGPLSTEPDPFARIVRAQLSLAALIVIEYMLVIALFEIRNTVRLLRRSDERYRNFVEKTSEAIWQIDLTVPMPLGIPIAEQVLWLRKHAYIDECNLAYRQLCEQLGGPNAQPRAWQPDAPWSVIYLNHLEQAARHSYSIGGLQFSLDTATGRRTYLTIFTGVVVDNQLVSVWGLARDITELVQLNEKLNQRQARIQMYARELSKAEERARRATAVDLHDGIGQQLVGLAMTLDAAAARSVPEIRLQLAEASHTLREIHAITRRVIADLSPPGLYELGLEAALQWLSVYMRSHDNLQIELQVDIDESAFDLELRIVAFKLIRELLRNVIKHSGVKFARVKVSMTPRGLLINVADQGVGFEWQLSLFETRAEGFGLWSVVERVREAGGEIEIDTAPGRGCSVSVLLPLQPRAEEEPRRQFGAVPT